MSLEHNRNCDGNQSCCQQCKVALTQADGCVNLFFPIETRQEIVPHRPRESAMNAAA
jgi:hypothetical protein